jgi:hypothetical protein
MWISQDDFPNDSSYMGDSSHRGERLVISTGRMTDGRQKGLFLEG